MSPHRATRRSTHATADRVRIAVTAVLLAVYLAGLAALLLAPQRVDGDSKGVYSLLSGLYGAGLPQWITYSLVELLANVLILIPFGALGALLLPRRLWWWVPIACSVLSLGIEVAQAFLPPRMPSAWDWAANSIGGLIGAAIVAAWRANPAERAPLPRGTTARVEARPPLPRDAPTRDAQTREAPIFPAQRLRSEASRNPTRR